MEKFVSVKDFEDHFQNTQSSSNRSFVTFGSEREVTLRENEKVFTRMRIIPRVLRDVSQRDLSTTLLGERVSFPVGVAPMGAHGYFWPGGEVDTFKGAAASGVCCVLSTFSNRTLADVAAASSPGALPWFQLYMMADRNYSEYLIKEVEKFGYKALVLTVDVPVMGLRWRNMKEPTVDMSHQPYALTKDKTSPAGTTLSVAGMIDRKLTWQSITWLRSLTNLPIIIKGILSPDDASLAVKYGASGVWVSNHGGRQMDTAPTTLEMLPSIMRAVDGKAEVYMDGGVRTGSDVFKALALGAKAVFVGRPVLWGLAAKGSDGVHQVLEILQHEFDTCMALAGCTKISDINESYILNGSQL